jgi:hypothetical protein
LKESGKDKQVSFCNKQGVLVERETFSTNVRYPTLHQKERATKLKGLIFCKDLYCKGANFAKKEIKFPEK